MTPFYHFTDPENLESILKTGLLPGVRIGKNNWHDIGRGDNRFIYLFGEKRYNEIYMRRFFVDKIWLRISLPADFPVERDYDQILVSIGGDHSEMFPRHIDMVARKLGLDIYAPGNFRTVHIALLAERFSEYGIVFLGEPTPEIINSHTDKIDSALWENIFGSYRIQSPVPPKFIETVPLPERA